MKWGLKYGVSDRILFTALVFERDVVKAIYVPLAEVDTYGSRHLAEEMAKIVSLLKCVCHFRRIANQLSMIYTRKEHVYMSYA